MQSCCRVRGLGERASGGQRTAFGSLFSPSLTVGSRDLVQVVSLSRKCLDQLSPFRGFKLSNDSKILNR